ncbi:sister chromatid cohesion protein pds5-like [Senna tora]|uniref:Sister chromatid cohesion protein pds5-like n=1 Tax=Senna tora TaxID=362788 RepID=A0A834W9R9_9FABA|nr:sister chromatid cohesion protein pds5-like [Senna tora]
MLWCTNQTTTQPILEALTPLKDALVSRNLYRHEDENIKIATISCIFEIIRIPSPNSPYSDEQMKKLIRNCAIQLEPYLMQDVQSSGRDLNDYAQIVASICQDESNKMVEDDKKLDVSKDDADDQSRSNLERRSTKQPLVSKPNINDTKYFENVKPTVVLAIRASFTNEELLGCKIKVWWPMDEKKQKVEGESDTSGSVAKKAVSKFKRLRKLSDGIEAMNDLASQSHIFQGFMICTSHSCHGSYGYDDMLSSFVVDVSGGSGLLYFSILVSCIVIKSRISACSCRLLGINQTLLIVYLLFV